MAETLRANRLFIGILTVALALGLWVALWPAWTSWSFGHSMWKPTQDPGRFCAPGACAPRDYVEDRYGWHTLPGALLEGGQWWDGAIVAVVVFVVLTGLVLSARALRTRPAV